MDGSTLRYDTITFLSDYGHTDESVGVVKSVIRQLCPAVHVVDLTHDIAPFDLRAGGLALARAAQYLAPGVVLATVAPGTSAARRLVAVEVGDGAAVLVGPDTGLLAPAVQMVGGATRAVELDDTDHHLEAPGTPHPGRDVLAPVAARLCLGVPLTELGTTIEPAGLLPGVFPISDTEDGSLSAEVLWVDRYGSAQLNVAPEELDALGTVFELHHDEWTRTARRAERPEQVGTGALGLVVDSYGMVAVVSDRTAAAGPSGLDAGDQVRLVPLDDAEPAAAGPGVTSAVSLSSRPAGAVPDRGAP